MKYALFLGCKIPSLLPAYAASTRAVLQHLGFTLIDLDFDGAAGNGRITVRQRANGDRVLFESTVEPRETSRDKPLRLDWS